MECPNCYDETVEVSGYRRIVNRHYLEMEKVGYDSDYNYYQCSRCTLVRKQQKSFWGTGLVENVHSSELHEIAERASEGNGALGTVLFVGLGILLLGALLSD